MLKKEVKQVMEQSKVIYEYDRVAHGLNRLQASLNQLEAVMNMNSMQRRYNDPDLIYRRVRVEKQPRLFFPLNLLDQAVEHFVRTVVARWMHQVRRRLPIR